MLPVLTFTHLLLCSTGDNCKNIFPWGKPQWNIGIPNKQSTNLQWYDQHVPHLSETWHFWAVQHAVFRDITGSPNFPDYWRSILVPRLFCGNESPTAPWTMFLIMSVWTWLQTYYSSCDSKIDLRGDFTEKRADSVPKWALQPNKELSRFDQSKAKTGNPTGKRTKNCSFQSILFRKHKKKLEAIFFGWFPPQKKTGNQQHSIWITLLK